MEVWWVEVTKGKLIDRILAELDITWGVVGDEKFNQILRVIRC